MLRLRDVVGLRAEGVKGGEGRGGQTSGGGGGGWLDNRRHSERAGKFKTVCERLGGWGKMLNTAD